MVACPSSTETNFCMHDRGFSARPLFFKVLKLSDELEQLKKRDVDEHADRLLTDGRPPDGLEKKISALSDELNACKAEKGRLDGTLEYLRNSLRLSDEQRKSSESNAEELQKELEELKVHYTRF